MVKLTGLWKAQSKKGESYLVGKISPTSNLVVFSNNNKKTEKDPDFVAFVSSPAKPEEKGHKEEGSFI